MLGQRERVSAGAPDLTFDIAITSAAGKPLLIGVVAELLRDAGHPQKPGIPYPLQELGGAARKDAAKSDQKWAMACRPLAIAVISGSDAKSVASLRSSNRSASCRTEKHGSPSAIANAYIAARTRYLARRTIPGKCAAFSLSG